MFCKECGANIDGARFCPSCGKPVQQMTIQPTKCSKCGAELQEGMRFCNQCGTPVVAMNSQTNSVQSAQPMQTKEQAEQSWKARQTEQENQAKQAREAWQAKLNQGNAQQGQSSIQLQQQMQQSKEQCQPKPQSQPVHQQQYSTQNKPQSMGTEISNLGNIVASKIPGETGIDIDDLFGEENVTEILSPVKALLGTIPTFVGNLMSMIKKPWKLIPVALIVGLWLFLWEKRFSTDKTIEFLSWLTYTDGGMYREGILGVIGGTLGMGMTGALLYSIFKGGIPAALKGFFGIFKSFGKGGSIFAVLLGAIVGAALYVAFAGYDEACADTAMAGIAGAIISLEAMGGKSSWFYNLAVSLTSKVQNGIRSARENAANGLLTGLAFGFALATIFFTVRG